MNLTGDITCPGCGDTLHPFNHHADERHWCALADCDKCGTRFGVQIALRTVGKPGKFDCGGDCKIGNYHRGCRCDGCRAIAAEDRKNYRARKAVA